MNKTIKLFSLCLCLIFLLGACGKSNSEDKSLKLIKDKGEFIVGLDDSFPPMGFRNENGEIDGFDIDLAKEVAKRIGVKVVFKPVEWDGVVLSLKNKDIDVIWNGLTITEKRKEQIAFSNVYLQNKQIIVVKNEASIAKVEDLKGKIVGVQLGSSSEEALNSNKEIVNNLKEIKKYSNNTEALLDLKAGRIEAVVIDEVVGRYYISKKAGEYKVLGFDLGKEDYGVGFRKEDKSFYNEVNKVLDEIKSDGTYDKISQKWFGEKLNNK